MGKINKFKIIHIISNLSIGGAQILLYDIVKNLKNKDTDVSVVTIDSGDYIKKFEDSGIRVINIDEKGLINPSIFFKLKKILQNERPDIVHTHLNKADFYGRIAAKLAGVPLIYSTCHNYSTTHSGADINKKSFFDFVDNFVINYTKSNIVAISNLVKEYLINRSKKYALLTEVIYNGVDINKEKYTLDETEQMKLKKKYNISENHFVISVIGRLENQKNQMFFLKSMKDILLENQDIKILVIGEGSNRSELEEYVKKYLPDNLINFTGFIFDTEQLIEISDMICVPSLWEGFGLVIIEAMIKRKIVLASDVGGIPEIVEDGINGFLFKSNNQESFREKFNYIYRNRNNFQELKENAVNTVKKKFDIQKNSELYYNSYLTKLNALISN